MQTGERQGHQEGSSVITAGLVFLATWGLFSLEELVKNPIYQEFGTSSFLQLFIPYWQQKLAELAQEREVPWEVGKLRPKQVLSELTMHLQGLAPRQGDCPVFP